MLADATRVRIIMALRDASELSVNRLAETVDKSPAAVSQHLAKLRLARIVSTRQEGTRIFYRLENEHAQQLVADAIFQACLLYTSPSPRDRTRSRMPSSA